MLDLRPYQSEALQRVYQAYKDGKRRVIVSLPTGTGKTVVFAHFPRFFKMKKRLLVLAHREELLLQAQEKFLQIDPEVKVGIEQSVSRAPTDAKVVIASVPTLGRAGGSRLRQLSPEEFFLIVVDEAHHAVAPTYLRIFEHFGLLDRNTSRYLVGFTATPRRGDKQGLGAVFQEVCYARDLREMVAERYLCPITGWRIYSDTSLDDVKIRHGDFVESQLAEAVNTIDRNNLLVSAYRKHAAGRRAIIFCVNVAHAMHVCQAFQSAGIRSSAVWGDMPREERRLQLAQFSSGDIDVITNCNVLTEGFDEPRVDAVVMARPTRSKLLYAQMVGRGTRRHPDKKDLNVIDIADNSKAHHLPGLNDLFNLPSGMNLQGTDALKTERAVEELTNRFPWVDIERIHTPTDVKFAAERIDFWNFDPPAELADFTPHMWHTIPGGYRLLLKDGETLLVESNLLDTWNVHIKSPKNGATLLKRVANLESAIAFADSFLSSERPDSERLAARNARWRDEDPTDKQIEILKRNRINVPPELTRGQASQMIAYILGSPLASNH
ncbi:MAG TPA: DEAD/DEAH box helicase [Candidatus Angelobacter sp.]|nr:DEAD/DEAH box helicase [Candidatus Angelobacter sp.]